MNSDTTFSLAGIDSLQCSHTGGEMMRYACHKCEGIIFIFAFDTEAGSTAATLLKSHPYGAVVSWPGIPVTWGRTDRSYFW